MKNEYCHYIQHLFLILKKSQELYTHGPSLITRIYRILLVYVDMHICIYCVLTFYLIMPASWDVPSNDWKTVNWKVYGRTRLSSSLGHDHWTYLEVLRKALSQVSFWPDGNYEHVPLKHSYNAATLPLNMTCSVRMYTCMYVRAYVHACVHTYVRKYLYTVCTLCLFVPDFRGQPPK